MIVMTRFIVVTGVSRGIDRFAADARVHDRGSTLRRYLLAIVTLAGLAKIYLRLSEKGRRA